MRIYTTYLLGLTILLVITSFLIYNNYNKVLETFMVSPINSYSVNENKLDIYKKIDISKDIYSSSLEKKFGKINLKEMSDKIYANEFVLRNLLQTITKDELNNQFPDGKIEVSEIEMIGWDEVTNSNSVIFNFDINLINRNVMWIIPVKAWIQLDTTQICQQTRGCVETISQLIKDNVIKTSDLSKYFKLIGIKINDIKKNEITGIDPSSPNYFQIKNRLYLTEPFFTSREEIQLKNKNN